MKIKLKDGTMVEAERVDETIYNGEPQVMVTMQTGSYTIQEADKLFTDNCDPMEVYGDSETLMDTLTGYKRVRIQKHYEKDEVTLTAVVFAE